MKKQRLAILLMILIVPLCSELKFYPFDLEFSSFRVSLGTPAFLFFLVWLRKTSFALSGLLVGCSVLAFRLALDWSHGSSTFPSIFMLHFPAFFYYLTYSLIFHLKKTSELYNQPLRIGLLAISAEITASIVQLILSMAASGSPLILTLPIVTKLSIIAIIRSFFILSFFFIINLRQAEFMAEQQREQNEHLLLLISSLYAEGIQLAKSMLNAENITRECYHLYKDLHNCQLPFNQNDLAQSLLTIAGQIHDIKKDNQRIYASLTQLISSGKLHDYMMPSELGDIIVQSQQKYARSLNKTITFELQVEEILPPLHVYTVLSLVNNLVSNALESIKATGCIKISFYPVGECIAFRVSDTGPGIPLKKRTLIFNPGYTTKFDRSGTPSTGMGLPYIKDLVTRLHGTVTLEDSPDQSETIFIIRLPLEDLIKEV